VNQLYNGSGHEHSTRGNFNLIVLDGSGNGFERNFTIKLKQIEGLMGNWVKYHQNQKPNSS